MNVEVLGRNHWNAPQNHVVAEEYIPLRSDMIEKEEDIGRIIIPWLESQEWEVFQEVRIGSFTDRRADIVCRRGSVIYVLELKKSFSLSLLEQAEYWTRYAHYVSVVVPRSKKRESRFSETVSARFGIGLIRVNQDFVYESVRPEFRRRAFSGYWRTLGDQYKDSGNAGNSTQEYFTPFRNTVSNIKSFLRNHPNATLQQIVDNSSHHYSTPSTAKACIAKWIKTGVIKEIEVVTDTKPYRYRLST